MLKCGQKNNKNYTFGVRREQIEDINKKESDKICCAFCGTCLTERMKYCPSCGEKLS